MFAGILCYVYDSRCNIERKSFCCFAQGWISGPEIVLGLTLFVHPITAALGFVPVFNKLTVTRNNSTLCCAACKSDHRLREGRDECTSQ